jgi:lysophospholipase L1-like esterase
MLGTNDCNRALEKQEAELMEALGQYETKMKEWLKQLGIAGMPKLLIVSPPYIKKSEAEQNENIQRIFGPDAEERSKKLASYYKKFCQQNSVSFFDAAEVCETAPKEGIHLDEENNRKLGEALAKEVRKII